MACAKTGRFAGTLGLLEARLGQRILQPDDGADDDLGGWADNHMNAVAQLAGNVPGPVKGVVGPQRRMGLD